MKNEKAKVGDTIRIDNMEGEPNYTNRVGVVTIIDDAGQLIGTWGGLSVLPDVDSYTIIKKGGD